MESFASFASGFNIHRRQMPQIDDQQKFADFLKSKDVSVDFTIIPLSDLNPTQFGSDTSNTKPMSGDYTPIICTSDGYILDGHHRFYSLVAAPDCYEAKVMVVDTTINNALSLAYQYLEVINGQAN